MYRYLESRLAESVRDFLRRTYQLEVANLVIEQPPKIQFGEYALPIAFELARKLRKAPRKIAEEIVAGIGPVPGIEKFRDRRSGLPQCPGQPCCFCGRPCRRSDPSRCHPPGQGAGRAFQHQSQQGRAHRASAQRDPGRHVCPPAAVRGQGSGYPELHRQHRGAGGGCGGWLSAPGTEVPRPD